MNLYQLHNTIPTLQGLTALKRQALNDFGLSTIFHLLTLFPLHYTDRSHQLNIRQITPNLDIAGTFQGYISNVQEIGFRHKKRLSAQLSDQTGTIELLWFRYYPNLIKKLGTPGPKMVYGKVQYFKGRASLTHPEVYFKHEFEQNLNQLSGFQPDYSSPAHFKKAKIHSKLIQKWILSLIDKTDLPYIWSDIVSAEFDLSTILKSIHQPKDVSERDESIEKMKLLEFLIFQLQLNFDNLQKTGISKSPYTFQKGYVSSFIQQLPFDLTKDQLDVLSQIKKEVQSGHIMHRLIQGDVGSGKTVVAFLAMLMAVEQGKTACLMAPTEILSEQHLNNFLKLTSHLSLRTAFLSGSTTTAKKKRIYSDLANGQIDVLIGTHALFQDKVQMPFVDLIVIDEQHRFGVAQRKALQQKGDNPHILLLSATPIPRSLSLALYGDLDISYIKQKPKGRKEITTAIRTERDRDNVYRFLENELREGGRVYFVFPLVEESEKIDLKNATVEHEKLSNRFPEYQVGLVHGRMSAQEKEIEMQKFKNGEYKLLVSTTVIEVGVDVPEASVIVIEEASRFGLSQLHQLRGRVGRGHRKSYCILMTNSSVSSVARKRLNILKESTDGFFIAEKDLEIRGPGDMSGTAQSGLPKFKLASIVEDAELLEEAKNLARTILESDPQLTRECHGPLRSYLALVQSDEKNLSTIG